MKAPVWAASSRVGFPEGLVPGRRFGGGACGDEKLRSVFRGPRGIGPSVGPRWPKSAPGKIKLEGPSVAQSTRSTGTELKSKSSLVETAERK